MVAKPFIKALLLLLSAGLVLIGILFTFGSLFRPVLDTVPLVHTPDELEAIKALRDVSFDPNDLPVIWQDVDYTEGKRAAWYPKGESPILAELVQEGAIPPVAARVGEEPMVLEGVEGIGKYGGTWLRMMPNVGDMRIASTLLAGSTLVRFSPLGDPIVPAVAKRWEHNEDKTVWTFYLRKGMKWSDGHPFTAHDYVYHFEEDVVRLELGSRQYMEVGGGLGSMKALDDTTLQMTFPSPYPRLLYALAAPAMSVGPKHYLEQYHPDTGDPEKIRLSMESRGLPNPRVNYRTIRDSSNPERPSIHPWIRRTESTVPPFTFVRNPYYWAVDTAGNQLPYIDQIHFEVKDTRTLPLAAASGAIHMQARFVEFENYTLLMDLRKEGHFRLLHWFPATRSKWTLFPNLNRRIEPGNKNDENKHALLNEADFRRALSLAINRQDIINADYSGIGEPAQLAPGRESSYHHEGLLKAYTDYDPARANRLLDGLGLDQRDSEGYRTFPDGSRMDWSIEYTAFTGGGTIQFVIDAWRHVGIRAVPYERTRSLFYTRKAALQCDFVVWPGESEFDPLLSPRSFVPTQGESHQAIAYGNWYRLGGLRGDPLADQRGQAPPEGGDIRRTMELLDQANAALTEEEQHAIFNEIFDLNATHVWTISIATPPPQLVVVSDFFRNVPQNAIMGYSYNTPANTGVETYFFSESSQTPAAAERIKKEMTTITLPARVVAAREAVDGGWPHTLMRWFLIAASVLVVLLLAVRHPFIGRRLLWAIPTLTVISVIVFTIIQAPPGSYLESYIMQRQMVGDEASIEDIAMMREMFHMDDSATVKYLRWMGIYWFATLDKEDRGLLQGDLGRSMETQLPVNQMVGDRILLTMAISFATIIVTWIIALPIGIYSAIRQYSIGDYIFTFFGFIGLCIPNFLLALLLMYASHRWLGLTVTGLFSPDFAANPDWSWAKFVDLLKHIWIPVIVLGTAGTANMIRVMRANLLDEVQKPYVTTARAKGVRPFKLLIKYPVRMALNPFVSSIGNIFPQLMSGGAIVAIVLSLPTVGPMLLQALLSQDMYLAGSMLMVLSTLTIIGVLVSDLLLLALDPRIRMEKGGK